MNVLSLFSGIGGLELGLERAGMTVIGQVEIDEFCRRVLAKHWPEVPRHDDVRTAVEWWRGEQRPRVHVVAGGFPCQPASSAGRRLAQKDPRWLWPAMGQLVSELQPEWVIGENVLGLLDRGLADVVRDLRGFGYRVRVGQISACAMGAPHPRQRLFILAHSESSGCGWGGCQHHNATRAGGSSAPIEALRRNPLERPDWWQTEPDVARMANGISRGVDRRRALGNAVVPQVAEYVGRLIVEHTSAVAA